MLFCNRSRQEGVVLIAQEERAADVVTTGLLEGAEEQKILVIENKNRTEITTKADATNSSTSTQQARLAHDVATNRTSVSENKSSAGNNTLVGSRGEMCRSNIDEHFEQPLGRLLSNEGEKNSLKTTLYPSSNGTLKRDLNAHMTHGSKGSASSEENLNGQRDSVSEEGGPAKRPRLSSLENELDHSSSIPSRTGSPTPLVNGDIKGDPRNKLMDKLLDKDLHLPLNGVCGIDTSELDLLASDGERLSSSKASSPDLFGSETNSDFGKYLEESDTDTGLFSDVLQGDLRIDPMENGTEGTHPMPSKMPTFPGGSYIEGGNISNEKGIPSGVAEQQGKIPIPPAVRPDPLPGQYNVTASRHPVAGNTTWNSTNNVTQMPKPGFGQRFGPEVQQKMAFYPQQGNLPPNVGNRSSQMHNVNMNPPHASQVAIQKPTFLHQNIQPSPQQQQQQMITSHDSSSALHPSGVPKNILPRPQGADIINSMVAGTVGIQHSSPASTPFHVGQQMPSVQTSIPRVNTGMQPGWAPSGVQQQQVPVEQHAGPRTLPGPQKVAAPPGFQVGLRHNSTPGSQASIGPPGPQNMGLSSGWQPQLQQQQKAVNVYPDIRTQGVATPGSSMYDAASAPQNRQPPPQYQLPAGKNVVVQKPLVPMPVTTTGSQEFAATLPAHGSQTESAVPLMTSFKPYRCRWTTCYR